MNTRNINISRICTGNNTIRTAWDAQTQKTIKTISAGRLGLKGARRGSPYAAELVGRELSRVLEARTGQGYKITNEGKMSNVINIYLAGKMVGIGSGVRGLRAGFKRFKINSRTDVTPKPHNGCRARKARRV